MIISGETLSIDLPEKAKIKAPLPQLAAKHEDTDICISENLHDVLWDAFIRELTHFPTCPQSKSINYIRRGSFEVPHIGYEDFLQIIFFETNTSLCQWDAIYDLGTSKARIRILGPGNPSDFEQHWQCVMLSIRAL